MFQDLYTKQSKFIPFDFHKIINYDFHLLFKKLVEKNEKVKPDIIPKKNSKNLSITNGRLKFFDRNGLVSRSLDSPVKTFVNNKHKMLKNLREEANGDDGILKTDKEKETLFSEDRYNIESLGDSKKDFPDENEKLKEALNNFISEIDLEISKTKIPFERNYLIKKLAYPYE